MWPTGDQADPLTGWPIWAVRKMPSIASPDIYGKLFECLKDVMSSFLERVNSGNVDFELYRMDAEDLSHHLTANSYDRIEVSIIRYF